MTKTVEDEAPPENLEGVADTAAQEAPAKKAFDRKFIREAILDSKGESELVDAFGCQIEVKAPQLEDLLQYRDAQDDDLIMGRAIVNNCYVPGTDEKVFEPTDVEAIMKLQFGSDMKRLQGAINRALGADSTVVKAVDGAVKSDPE